MMAEDRQIKHRSGRIDIHEELSFLMIDWGSKKKRLFTCKRKSSRKDYTR